MAKFDNIIIVSDMDGTFLGSGSRIISQNMRAIEYFNQNGGRFTFNTGRGYTNVALRFPEVMCILSAPMGLHNGSCIYDTQKDCAVEEIFIDNSAACEISKYLISLPSEINFTLRTTRKFYAVNGQQHGHFQHFAIKFPQYSEIISFEYIKKLDVQKIFFEGEQEKINSIRQYIEATYSNYIQCTTGGTNYIEIDPIGSTKARHIHRLKDILGLPNAKIFAIGDYENDLEMLRAADFAVCPENAMDMVKCVTDITVCHHDKGAIADLIRIIEERYLG